MIQACKITLTYLTDWCVYCMLNTDEKLSDEEQDVGTLPNYERVKVKGTNKVIVRTHNIVQRRLGDVKYVPKFKRNLISFDRLSVIGCSFKTNGGSLKFIRGSMVLMMGRSKSNLYIFYKLVVVV